MRTNPKTRKEAEQTRYGVWAGHPNGNPFDPEYCAAHIQISGRGSLPVSNQGEAMTEDQQLNQREEHRMLIAQACGWTDCRLTIKGAGGGTRRSTAHGKPPKRKYEADCPNYFGCLNACAEMVANLAYEEEPVFLGHLKRIIMRTSATQGASEFEVFTAKPTQICEAFILTKNLKPQQP